MQARATLRGFETVVQPRSEFKFDQNTAGCIVQYPDTEGTVHDYEHIVQEAHEANALVACVTDPLACTVLKTPGEFDADVAVGTTQRFGIPLWLGGPHAAFFATKDKFKRLTPGRIVGKTLDSFGNSCYRLALQTREQHIKRDKATSNVCTAQALLANASAFYAVYKGPEGLKNQAKRIHALTKILAIGCQTAGHSIANETYFDTLKIQAVNKASIIERAESRKINLRQYTDGESVGVALNELTSIDDISDLLFVFGCEMSPMDIIAKYKENMHFVHDHPTFKRVDQNFLPQRVFNTFHSEAEFSRYARSLELKDLSLVDSMIPLGSCTMKLNSSTSLDSMTMPSFRNF